MFRKTYRKHSNFLFDYELNTAYRRLTKNENIKRAYGATRIEVSFCCEREIQLTFKSLCERHPSSLQPTLP